MIILLKVSERAIIQVDCVNSAKLTNDLGAVADNDKLIRFWGHKVRGQGHHKMRYGLESTWGILKVIHSNITDTDTLSSEGVQYQSVVHLKDRLLLFYGCVQIENS